MDTQERTALRNERALDQRARRAAARVGLKAIKANKYGNHGFMLINPARCWLENGYHFELSAEDVIEFCNGYQS